MDVTIDICDECGEPFELEISTQKSEHPPFYCNECLEEVEPDDDYLSYYSNE